MTDGTIHTYDRQWDHAQIVGVDDETLTVQHPGLGNEANIEFEAEEDEQGQHSNVGNHAFWLTLNQ